MHTQRERYIYLHTFTSLSFLEALQTKLKKTVTLEAAVLSLQRNASANRENPSIYDMGKLAGLPAFDYARGTMIAEATTYHGYILVPNGNYYNAPHTLSFKSNTLGNTVIFSMD